MARRKRLNIAALPVTIEVLHQTADIEALRALAEKHCARSFPTGVALQTEAAVSGASREASAIAGRRESVSIVR